MAYHYQGIIEKYRSRLPLAPEASVISLAEGNTPLIELKHLSTCLTTPVRLYAKYEGLNPTGSFKDRGMTVAISHAKSRGCQAVICASTGNTSAAAAAYAARAAMVAFVLVPAGNIALGKLAQARMHGAQVIQIQGNFDEGLRLVREVAQRVPIEIVNSINPMRLAGQKTAAFEIVEALGQAPDYHFLPVGNAGNISAYWMGYQEYYHDRLCAKRPRMVGYQAAGSAPFVLGQAIAHPQTVATAIRIGDPQSWDKAVQAQSESGGWFDSVTDDEILAAQRLLAGQEGIFCEPASAASVAGLLQADQQGQLQPHSVIVCTLTGHGLKDPEIALSNASHMPLHHIDDLTALEQLICQTIEPLS